MRPISVSSKCVQSEASIQDALRRLMAIQGWTLTEKTHGNSYQAGWPDLMCFHPVKGIRWVEVKRPKGSLTRSQRARFASWEQAGLGVYVIAEASLEALRALDGHPNWRDWM